jgi:indolepyruvate decarboxylase
VEGADLLLCLGAWMTDLDLGGYTATLNPARMVVANSERVKIRHHVFEHVPIKDYLDGLRVRLLGKTGRFPRPPLPSAPRAPHTADPGAILTADRFWARMNEFLKDDHIVVSDTGSSTFETVKLRLPRGADFLGQAFYASMGFAIPAALGAKLASPRHRPVVFVGDGAFQMTGQELSTIIRHGQNPIILLLNNDGYQTERAIYDNAYNDLRMWDYTLMPEVFGGVRGIRVVTEGDLETVLADADVQQDRLFFIEVRLGRFDYSETLRRIGERLR